MWGLCADILLPPFQLQFLYVKCYIYGSICQHVKSIIKLKTNMIFSEIKDMQFFVFAECQLWILFLDQQDPFQPLSVFFPATLCPTSETVSCRILIVVMFMKHCERDTSSKWKDCTVGLISVFSRKNQEEERKTKLRDLQF